MKTYVLLKKERHGELSFNSNMQIDSTLVNKKVFDIDEACNVEWRKQNLKTTIYIKFKDSNTQYPYPVSNIIKFQEKEMFYKELAVQYSSYEEDDLLMVTSYYRTVAFSNYDSKKANDSEMQSKNISVAEWLMSKGIATIAKVKTRTNFTNTVNYYHDKVFYSEDFLRNRNRHIQTLYNSIEGSTSLRQYFFNEIIENDSNEIYTYLVNDRFNPSQLRAIDSSLKNNLTILQGPPGTGKSTTIINIIVSAIMDGKTVLVTANNNLPLEGVMESLEEIGLNQFWWRMGNKTIASEYIESHTEIKLNEGPFKNIKNVSNKTKVLIDTISQQAHTEYYRESLLNWTRVLNSLNNKIEKYNLDIDFKGLESYEKTISKAKWPNFLFSIVFMKKRKINKLSNVLSDINKVLNIEDTPFSSREDFDEQLNNIKTFHKTVMNDYIQHHAAKIKFKTLEDKIQTISNVDEDVMKFKKDKKYFENVAKQINEKFSDQEKMDTIMKQITRSMYKKSTFADDLSHLLNDDDFLERFREAFPVTFTTNMSISKLPFDNYDYVIIDEAGQADIMNTLQVMTKGDKLILSGDIKQLEPIYTISKAKDDSLSEGYGISQMHQCHQNSVMNYFSKVSLRNQNVLLNEHYRCDKNISSFFNRHFYGGRLSNSKLKTKENIMGMLISNGKKTISKNINKKEIEQIIEQIKDNNYDLSSFGIITPFKAQASAIKKEISVLFNVEEEEITNVGTVHTFQGKEYDKIFFSGVLSGGGVSEYHWDMLNNKNLINVAVSRAKSEFYLVTNEGCIAEIKKNHKNDIFYKLYDFIVEKKYDDSLAFESEVETIENMDRIKPNKNILNIKVSDLMSKTLTYAKDNNYYTTCNVFKRDILIAKEMENYNFDETFDLVMFDSLGNIILVTDKKKVAYSSMAFEESELNQVGEEFSEDSFTSLMTPNEYEFMNILLSVYKGFIVMPNVAVRSVMNVSGLKEVIKYNDQTGNNETKPLTRMNMFHYDFVIYEKVKVKGKKILNPIHVIELDDKSHLKIETEIRDKIKDENSALVGIDIKRYLTLDRK